MSNSTKSDFQLANPLSPRKFWKKMIEQGFTLGIFIFVILSPFFIFLIKVVDPEVTPIATVTKMIGLLSVSYLVIVGIYAIYVKFYIKYYFYDGGMDFITIKKGVFAPTEIHVQYQKIQDVYVDQDILDRMMGLYDVHIASATVSSGIEAHIDGVEKETAERLKDFFLQKINEKTNGKGNLVFMTVDAPGSQNVINSKTLNLNEVVSVDTYPISDRWVFVEIVGTLMGNMIMAPLVIAYFFIPNEGETLASVVGLSLGNAIWLGLLFIITLTILQTSYSLLWKSTFSFNFLPEYIFMRTGIIARQEKHLPYNTIQDVSVNQGIIDRLFGIATIIIKNASGSQFLQNRDGNTAVFNGVVIPGQPLERAQKIAQILKEGVLLRTTQKDTGL